MIVASSSTTAAAADVAASAAAAAAAVAAGTVADSDWVVASFRMHESRYHAGTITLDGDFRWVSLVFIFLRIKTQHTHTQKRIKLNETRKTQNLCKLNPLRFGG